MRMAGGSGATPGKIVKLKPSDTGYLTVNLSRDSKRKTFNVHWLVARTFLGDPPTDEAGNYQIHHGPDPGITNNHAANLSYLTQKDNLEEQRQRWYQTRGRG